ncbi:hypothetical protein V5O48_009970 [Marasmius crinis-equi]|uniref:Uncharacterized protein n=1 Tax=Marasmius crinis-equi TaxID=585013 RepID=A0ABR3FA53_9AGAR
MWDVKTRGRAIAIFSVAPFIGPALGPTVAGFMRFVEVALLVAHYVYWSVRDDHGTILARDIYVDRPILLVKRAKKLRKETGDDRYYAPMEATKRTLAEQVENVLGRPFKMLFQEPMLAAITAYMSFVYGCLYLYFAAYPIVFARGHHFNAGISGLMFLPIALGGFIAITTYTFTFSRRYEREASRCAPNPVVPEFRLEMTLIGAPIYAISFFWFGWTSSPSTSFWAPLMSGVLNGFGISWIFLSLINYVIDTYLRYAASALSINTVVRSVFGAAFPLFAQQMYEGLGSQWASSLLGFVALAMVPMPFIFIKYGAQLRARSRYSPTAPPRSKESEKSAA